MREKAPKSGRSVLRETEFPSETAKLPVSVPGGSSGQENIAGIDRLLTDFLTDLNRLSDAIGTSPGPPNSESDPTPGSPAHSQAIFAEPRPFERNRTSEQLKILHDLHCEELSKPEIVPLELPGHQPASSAPSKKHPDPELDRTLDQLERKQSKIIPSPSGSAVPGKRKGMPGTKRKSGTEGPGKALQANPDDGPYQELRSLYSTRKRRPNLRMIVLILGSALFLVFLFRQFSGWTPSGPTAKLLPPDSSPPPSSAVPASASSEIDAREEAGKEKVALSSAEPRGTVSSERINPIKSRPIRIAAENRESAPPTAKAANNLPQQTPGSAAPLKPPVDLPTVSPVAGSATVPVPAPDPQKPDTTTAPSVGVLPENQAVTAPAASGGSIPNPPAETGTTKPPADENKAVPATEKNEPPTRTFVPPVPAKAIEKVAPLYPALLKSLRMNAVVLLEADVDENGKVTSVRTITGLKMLRYEAEQAVKKWKFLPATIDGVRVRSTVQVTVNFKN